MKHLFRPLALAAACAATVAVGSAMAESPVTPAVAPAAGPVGPAGYEIRGALPGTYEPWEHHVWRFDAGGRVTGSLSAQQIGLRQPGFVQSDDVGRWRKVGQTVCITWRTWFQGRELCYRMVMLNGGRILFDNVNGTVNFEGTYRRRGI